MPEIEEMNTALIEQAFAFLPAERATALLALLGAEDTTREQLEAAVQEALQAIDWETQREQVGRLVNRIMPLETLVPDRYAEWRPVVRDAIAFVGSHLSAGRLVPKLAEQIMLPIDLPLAKRLTLLIARMPSMQKIGQIVARNPRLDPLFRTELIRLENEIQDITVAEILAEITRQLGAHFSSYEIELQEIIVAEASVSAVVPFTWTNSTSGQREAGVFKVLKPYIKDYFSQELDILQGLAIYFDTHGDKYELINVNLERTFSDIRRLLQREIDFPNEQKTLIMAGGRYAAVSQIRIPRLIPELSTPTITAMSREGGIKVTEAYLSAPAKRKALARRIIEALICIPLFTPEYEAYWHADPHAGNLFVDDQTDDLILFDWALNERVSLDERRQILLLILATMLRDEEYLFNTIATLSSDNLKNDQPKADLVRQHIAGFIDQLSPITVPGLSHTLALLNDLLLANISFSTPFIIFRKLLFTLNDVLHEITSEVEIDAVLLEYALKHGLLSIWALHPLGKPAPNFTLPLSALDWLTLNWSARFFAGRVWLQTVRQIKKIG